MDRIQKIILISIISIAAISWILSKDQPDMMMAMMNYNPVAISLFTISWTIGMTAMMFPAMVPMVLLYNRLTKRSNNSSNGDNTIGKGINSSESSVFAKHMMMIRLSKEKHAKTTTLSSNFAISVNLSFL